MDTWQNAYAVILAGGNGTRFWPKSRQQEPKQLCKIGPNQQTMIEVTLARLDGVIPPQRRVVVTHAKQVEKTRAIVGDQVATILAEPEAKNTAAALSLAALEIQGMGADSQALMLSFHADHLIGDTKAFHASLSRACQVAQTGKIVLLGIQPDSPETGYGYIARGQPLPGFAAAYEVASFKEKPDPKTAQAYLEAQTYYWNSGIFVWSIGLFLEEMRIYLPRTIDILSELIQGPVKCLSKLGVQTLEPAYKKLQNIAIDHALLEVSTKTAVIEASFTWKDVGSWDALEKCFPTDAHGNLLFGEGLLLDSRRCTIDSDGPFIAALGIEDLVIVAAKNAVLICPKHKSQDVKKIVEALKEKEAFHLL